MTEDRKEAVKRIILEPMMTMYQQPDHVAADAATRQYVLQRYVDVLSEHPDRVWQDAGREVLRTHRSWRWPTPGAFIEAIREYYRGQDPDFLD